MYYRPLTCNYSIHKPKASLCLGPRIDMFRLQDTDSPSMFIGSQDDQIVCVIADMDPYTDCEAERHAVEQIGS